jgi:hypothetical protein
MMGSGRYINTVPKRNRRDDVDGIKKEPSVESLALPGFEELIEEMATVSKKNRDGIKKEPMFQGSDDAFREFWDAYPEKRNKPDALKAFNVLRRTVPVETIAKAFNGYMDFLKHQRVDKGFEQAPMYPATFLRSERWKEYLDFKYKAKL